jgi:PAS domain-containing protein
MTTPPDFGGTEIEEGLQEDRFGIAPEEHPGAGRDDLVADPHEDNEATAPGETCARCGNQIQFGEDARRRADGRWVHEVCPQPTA